LPRFNKDFRPNFYYGFFFRTFSIQLFNKNFSKIFQLDINIKILYSIAIEQEERMPYEWSSDLETGNYAIDEQHKQLFDTLNSLINAQRLGKGVGELYKAVEFLTVYVIRHFEDEEKLADDYDYPDRSYHKSIHDDFKGTVKVLVGQLRKEGYNDIILNNTVKIVSDWLVHHIKKEDFKLIEYIKINPNGKNIA
jgi:hemerythrin-like metal-binding protein